METDDRLTPIFSIFTYFVLFSINLKIKKSVNKNNSNVVDICTKLEKCSTEGINKDPIILMFKLIRALALFSMRLHHN